jgi:[ribosomal protein S5]-alanine N-acetyltransferase
VNLQACIDTPRFRLRALTLDDVTERYLGWFRDTDAARHIASARDTRALADLSAYVAARLNRDDVLFLGIFDRATGEHIGNLKYEPVNAVEGYAIMGILIGEPEYRGRGVGTEVLVASARWLRDHRHITQIVLGVSTTNERAIRSYQAAGFAIEDSPHMPGPHPEYHTMVLRP